MSREGPRHSDEMNDEFPDEGAPETGDVESRENDTPEGDVETLRAETDHLRAEKQALYEKLARAQADYQNASRRMERDLDQRLRIAAGQLVKSFLPVLDNLERAIEVPETADVRSVVEGVRGTYNQWLEVLGRNGVEQIAPEPGEPFDPERHEALMQEEAPADAAAGHSTVTRLLAKGYTFDGRVIRPAQVAVSRPE